MNAMDIITHAQTTASDAIATTLNTQPVTTTVTPQPVKAKGKGKAVKAVLITEDRTEAACAEIDKAHEVVAPIKAAQKAKREAKSATTDYNNGIIGAAVDFVDIPMNRISIVDGWNVREKITEESIVELAGSIKAEGLIHPITVQVGNDGGYTVVAGHRRFLACQHLKREYIAAKVVDHDKALSILALENLSRADLKAHEEVRAYGRLASTGMSARKIATAVGVSNVLVSERLLIGTYPELVTAMADADRPLAIKRAAALAQKAKKAKLTQIALTEIMAEVDEQYMTAAEVAERRKATKAAAKAAPAETGEGEDYDPTDVPPAGADKAKQEAKDKAERMPSYEDARVMQEAVQAALDRAKQDGDDDKLNFLTGVMYGLCMITGCDTSGLVRLAENPHWEDEL